MIGSLMSRKRMTELDDSCKLNGLYLFSVLLQLFLLEDGKDECQHFFVTAVLIG